MGRRDGKRDQHLFARDQALGQEPDGSGGVVTVNANGVAQAVLAADRHEGADLAGFATRDR